MSGSIEITDQLSLNVTKFRGDVWIHIRRKDKSVSVSSRDFEKVLRKKTEIKRLIEDLDKKKSHGKPRKYERETPEPEDSYESE